jgi:hypothetical protein
MQEKTDKKIKRFETHQKTSKSLFILFLILFCLLMSARVEIIFPMPLIVELILLAFHLIFFPIYIIYIIVSITIVFIVYRTIFIFNVIAILIITIYLALNLTGFCYKEFRYLSKQEIVDAAFEHTLKVCNENKKHNDECPSYQEIKQQYPQCFGDNISDGCIDETKVCFDVDFSGEKSTGMITASYCPDIFTKDIKEEYKESTETKTHSKSLPPTPPNASLSVTYVKPKETKRYLMVYRIEKKYSFMPMPIAFGLGFRVYSDVVRTPSGYNGKYRDPRYIFVSPCGNK